MDYWLFVATIESWSCGCIQYRHVHKHGWRMDDRSVFGIGYASVIFTWKDVLCDIIWCVYYYRTYTQNQTKPNQTTWGLITRMKLNSMEKFHLAHIPDSASVPFMSRPIYLPYIDPYISIIQSSLCRTIEIVPIRMYGSIKKQIQIT